MSERIPDTAVFQDTATKRLLVCKLEVVEDGIPFYKPILGRYYEFKSDAIRGASFKPQAQEKKE